MRIVRMGVALGFVALSGCSLLKDKTPDPATVVHTRMTVRFGDASSLERVREILAARARSLGWNAKVTGEGGDTVVVVVAGEVDTAGLVAPGALRFRKVLDSAPAVASGADTPAEPGPVRTRDEVVAKLGPAWQVAQGISTVQTEPDAALLEALTPFRALTPSEVAALPAEMQLRVPTIRCEQLGGRHIDAVRQADQRVVACDAIGTVKYLLDNAAVTTSDVREAVAQQDSGTGQATVTIRFTAQGQGRWTALTREVMGNEGSPCAESTLGDQGRCLVAIVADHHVLTTPEVQTVITGDAVITGSFSGGEAKTLASQIKGGELPVPVKIINTEVVRP
jgi:preprotein translocase subunit SecD